jgi:glycogen debranching enzyme
VHRAEPTFAPDVYWRGPTWPQLSYLLWVAATRARRADVAAAIAASTVAGAARSGLAEYWHPDTGRGLGAVPQSWTGLALLMAQ